jgi:hypothetical protein
MNRNDRIINLTKNKLEELNNQFFFSTEPFVEVYVNSKMNPNDKKYTRELNFIENRLVENDKDIFLMKNKLEVDLEEDAKIIRCFDNKINKLKRQNILLEKKNKQLSATALSAEGLMDDEFQLYRNNMYMTLIRSTSLVIAGFMIYKSFNR